MAGAFDSVIGSFKQSFDKRMLLYFALITVLYCIGSFIVQALFVNLPLSVLLGGFIQQFASMQYASDAEAGAALLGVLANFMKNLPFFLAATAAITIVYLAAYTFLGAVIYGLQFNIAKSVVEARPYSLQSAWGSARGRITVLFKAMLFLGIVFSIFFLALAAPLAIGVINLFASVGGVGSESIPYAILQLVSYLLAFALVSLLVLLFVSPLLVFLMPIALFEKHGAIESIRRSIRMGSRQYLSCLGFLLLLALVAVVALIAAGLVFAVLAVPLVLLTGIFGILLAILLFYLFIFAFVIWENAFVSLAITRFYLSSVSPRALRMAEANAAEEAPAAPLPAAAPKPKKKRPAKRARRKRKMLP